MRSFLSEWRLPLILGTLALLVLAGNILINLSWRENPKGTSSNLISLNQRDEGVRSNLPIEGRKPPAGEGETSFSDESKELEEEFQGLSTDSGSSESITSQEEGEQEVEAQVPGGKSQTKGVKRSGTPKVPEGYYLYKGKLYPLVRVHKIKLPDGRVVPLKLERGKKYRILSSWRNPNPRPLTPEEKRRQKELEEKEHRLMQEMKNEPSKERRLELQRELVKVWKELANFPTPCLGWDSVSEIWLRLPGQSEPSEVVTIDLRDY